MVGAGGSHGSSPLARGLQLGPLLEKLALGIIPARAGFTARGSCAPTGPADHPRSRGVYVVKRAKQGGGGGSSPLARGLRAEGALVQCPEGIIPARAGFTWADENLTPDGGDHPRSRGVYPASWSTSTDTTGSSPLARGLRRLMAYAATPVRIIPARAGFTRAWPSLRRCSADHPRSRGVYREGARFRVPQAGSSPLARGLRDT